MPCLAPAEQRVGKLAGSVSEGVPFVHRSVDVDDKTSDVLVKVIDNTVAANYSRGSWRGRTICATSGRRDWLDITVGKLCAGYQF